MKSGESKQSFCARTTFSVGGQQLILWVIVLGTKVLTIEIDRTREALNEFKLDLEALASRVLLFVVRRGLGHEEIMEKCK